jgi:hypothetical protein
VTIIFKNWNGGKKLFTLRDLLEPARRRASALGNVDPGWAEADIWVSELFSCGGVPWRSHAPRRAPEEAVAHSRDAHVRAARRVLRLRPEWSGDEPA